MATVLSLIQAACYETNAPVPTAFVGTTDAYAFQLTNLLFAECRYLRSKRWWPQLKRTFTLATVSGQASYQLPQDFYALAQRTNFDQTNHLEMIGPNSDSDWNYRLYGYVTIENRKAFKVFGPDMNPNSTTGQFYVNPTPGSSVATLSFDYISKTFFFPPNWAPLTAVAGAGTLYRNVNGNIYKLKTNGTTAATGPTAITGDITDGTAVWNYVSTPYETFVTDLDLCLFDDDLIIEGLRWRFLQARGLEYDAIKLEHESNVDEAVNRWQTGKVIHLGGSDMISAGLYPNTGEGNFG